MLKQEEVLNKVNELLEPYKNELASDLARLLSKAYELGHADAYDEIEKRVRAYVDIQTEKQEDDRS